jgi:hypothetical protein
MGENPMQSRARPAANRAHLCMDDTVEPIFTMNITQRLVDIVTRIRLEGATAGQPLGYAL